MESIEKYCNIAFSAPDGIKKLRTMILTLAVQGRLVSQDPNDKPASELLKEIQAEKAKLIKSGKIKKQKPLSPIPEEEIPFQIPKGWEWTRLGDALLKLTDGTHHSPPNTEKGDFLYISAKNIKEDGVLLSNATYVTKKIHEEIYSRCDPEYGNILYIKDGATTGIVTINNLKEPFSMLSSVALLKQPKQISNKYLLYVLRSPFFYSEMRAGMAGVAITRVTLEKMNNAIIPLPPVEEQQKIVEKVDTLLSFCDELDQLRNGKEQKRLAVNTGAINALLKASEEKDFNSAWKFIEKNFSELYSVKENVTELRKAILQLAVMGKLVPQDPKDKPASGLLKEIQVEKDKLIKSGKLKKQKLLLPITDKEIPFQIPQGWEWVRLGNIATFYNGDRSSRYPNESDLQSSGIPFFGAKDIQNGVLSLSDVRFISKKKFLELSGGKLEVGDFVILLRGTVGKTARFFGNDEFKTGFINAQMLIIRLLNPDMCDFVDIYFDSFLFQKMVNDKTTGAVIRQMPANVVEDFLIPLPPLEEQRKIIKKMLLLMSICDGLEVKILTSEQTQASLLSAIIN